MNYLLIGQTDLSKLECKNLITEMAGVSIFRIKMSLCSFDYLRFLSYIIDKARKMTDGQLSNLTKQFDV